MRYTPVGWRHHPVVRVGERATVNHRTKAQGKMLELRMNRQVYAQILQTVGQLPAETGGALGGVRSNGIITHFHFDTSAQRTSTTYSPDHHVLNQLFKNEWNPQGINLMGFVHSHPGQLRQPSGGDLVYARAILKCIPDLNTLWLPIVMSSARGGRFDLIPYAFVRDADGGHLVQGQLVQVDEAVTTIQPMVDEVRPGVSKSAGSSPSGVVDTTPRSRNPRTLELEMATPLVGTTFARVQHAYDLNRLAYSRLVIVGTGGAAGFIEDMARAGVGEFILIDPDTVSETNLATQQVYRRDIGRAKVDCLAERISDINPTARVLTLQNSLDDFIDEEVAYVVASPFASELPEPAVSLLCGFTDNFYAQARVNRLALKLGVPSLSAQVYWEGRGAEVVFTYPGITPACQRCILSKRYAAFLEQGYRNNVTSDGTPIFATTRLNAIKGFIALAILHHSTGHPRWGGLLERIAKRNLVQIRMDPDIGSTLGLRTFERAFAGADAARIVFDEAVWLPQQPENPETGYAPCPDCAGTGNLWAVHGAQLNTRDQLTVPLMIGD